jgi:hypothetical protein
VTYDEFATLLTHFAQRPVPAVYGRHVYLWHGEMTALRALLPTGLAVELDLYALAGELQRTPVSADEARRVLQTAIANWLRQHLPAPGEQQAVIVTGNSLLRRYRMPLGDFIQAASESRLFVFVVSPQETTFQPRQPLPGYVLLQPSATFDYLKTNLGERFVIGEATP